MYRISLVLLVFMLSGCVNIGSYQLVTKNYYKAACAVAEGRDAEAEDYLTEVIKEVASSQYSSSNYPYLTEKTDSLATKEIERAVALIGQLKTVSTYEKLGMSSDTLRQQLVRRLKQAYVSKAKNIQKTDRPYVEFFLFQHPAWFPLCVSLVALLCITAIYLRLKQNYKGILLENESATKHSLQQLEDATTKQLQQIGDMTKERLGIGQTIYQNVESGGTMKNISVDDEQSFIYYYAFTFPKQYAAIVTSYSKLSLRHTTYLILKEMGFSDTRIQDILFVSDSTIRNYRFRSSKNRIGK